jgi:L-malate glycosyltransferase
VKVLVLTSSFPRHEGSHEVRWILELAQWLSKRGFPAIVLAPHYLGGKLRESWGMVQVQRFVYFIPFRFERLAYGPGLLFNMRKDFFAFIGVLPFLASGFLSSLILIMVKPVGLVHTHWLIPQGFTGAVFHRIWKIPHVATVHGSDLNIITRHKVLAAVGRFVIRHSDVITVNSTYMKRQLESFAPDSRKRIRVIPMGIDPEKFSEGPFPYVKKDYFAGHIILSVGRLIDWKGTIYLINAMPKIIRTFPDTKLLIAGSGPEQESLSHKVHEHGLDQHVTFLGVVDDKTLLSLYHAADVFVLPSINKDGKTEALGVVLLEAMASGCPVIGSNVGGIPDIITDGENGFLVPEQDPHGLAEKIILLLSDERLREKFRSQGLIRVQQSFSWDRIADDFSQIFERVLSTRTLTDD